MKPLTIEELKALKVGDWFWVVDLYSGVNSGYVQIDDNFVDCVDFDDYGTDWLAYKNKEQAEAEEHCVICHKDISDELPKIDVFGNSYCKECYSDKCEKELLKQKMENGEIVELPYMYEYMIGAFEIVYLLPRNINNSDDRSHFQVERFRGKDAKIKAERRLAELKGEKE